MMGLMQPGSDRVTVLMEEGSRPLFDAINFVQPYDEPGISAPIKAPLYIINHPTRWHVRQSSMI
jgi:hypothetical protein